MIRLCPTLLILYLGGLIAIYLLFSQPVDTLKHFNHASAATLKELVKTKYFRMIRLNLNEDCPLLVMKKICKQKSCTVCRCDEKDIPSFWAKTDKVVTSGSGVDIWKKERQDLKTWVWHVQDEENDKGQYFDVDTNIESFTNYNGSMIWKLVYEENCFKGKMFEEMCYQEKILYKVISGLHTSISTHLSRFHKNVTEVLLWADLNVRPQDQFYFNQYEYHRRVLTHPERINNLLFIYQIFSLAVKQISPYLKNNFTVNSDNIKQDFKSSTLLQSFLKQIKEYDLSTEQKSALKAFTSSESKVKDIQMFIHNISRIMNCVECQKCRLFGKMQTYGVGTALKILFGYKDPYKRNQIVALFNTFNKLAMSVETFYEFKEKLQLDIKLNHLNDGKNYHLLKMFAYIGGGFMALIYIFSKLDLKKKIKKDFKNAFPKQSSKLL